jgi:hypothetical protein
VCVGSDRANQYASHSISSVDHPPSLKPPNAMIAQLQQGSRGSYWTLQTEAVLRRRRVRASAATRRLQAEKTAADRARVASAKELEAVHDAMLSRIQAQVEATRPAASTTPTEEAGGTKFATRWLAESAASLAEFKGRVRSLQAGVRSLNTGLATIRKAEAVLAARRAQLGDSMPGLQTKSFVEFLDCISSPIRGLIVAFAGSQATGALAGCSRQSRELVMDEQCWDELSWSRWHLADPEVTDGVAAAALYRTVAAAANHRQQRISRTAAAPKPSPAASDGLPAISSPRRKPAASSRGPAPGLRRAACLFRAVALREATTVLASLDEAVARGDDTRRGASAAHSVRNTGPAGLSLRSRLRDGLALAELITSQPADLVSAARFLKVGAVEALGRAAADSSGMMQELAASVLANLACVNDTTLRARIAEAARGAQVQRRLREMLASPLAPVQPLAAKEAARALSNLFVPSLALCLPLPAHHARGLLPLASQHAGSTTYAPGAVATAAQASRIADARAAEAVVAQMQPAEWAWNPRLLGSEAPWQLFMHYGSGEPLARVRLRLAVTVLHASAAAEDVAATLPALGRPSSSRLASAALQTSSLTLLLTGTGTDDGKLLVVAGTIEAHSQRASPGGRLQGWHAGDARRPEVVASAAATLAEVRERVQESLRPDSASPGADSASPGADSASLMLCDLLREAGMDSHLEMLLHSSGESPAGIGCGFWGVWEVAKGVRAASADRAALRSGGVLRLAPIEPQSRSHTASSV